MTQRSRPQPGHRFNLGSEDAGPYSADQWAEIFRDLFTSDPASNEGVIVGKGGGLFVTSSGNNAISVASGRAMVGGRYLRSDAATAFTAPSPAGNPRIDTVVAVNNNTASPLAVSAAGGHTLGFPTDLTDYDELSSVPSYTARLAIVRGTAASSPVAPTLDADLAALYMIPIARYQISTGGVISSLTDLRNFAAFSTAHLHSQWRQGGNADNWQTPGTTNYRTNRNSMQVGSQVITFGVGVAGGTITSGVTFPVPFSDIPLVFVTVVNLTTDFPAIIVRAAAVTASGFSVTGELLESTAGASFNANWMAIGLK